MKKLRMVVLAVLGLAAAAVLAVVPSETYKNDFTGNGSTTAFVYTFKTLSASWVNVYFGSTKQTSGFTVAVNANQDSAPGGTVTFSTAPPNLTEIHIQRATPKKQESAWPTASPFKPKTLETQLDKQTMALQEVDGRTTQLCEQVDQVMTLAQGPMGPQGPAGTNGTNGLNGSISSITQNLDFTSTYKNVNLAAPSAAGDSATKGYVDTVPTATALAISYGSGWASSSPAPMGRKTHEGLITLSGQILAATSGSNAIGTITATAYRPSATLTTVVACSQGSTSNFIRTLQIDTAGAMNFQDSYGTSGANYYCYLGSIPSYY